MTDTPIAALAYGANQGPGPALELLADWLPSIYGGALDPRELLITGGASAALDRLCSTYTRPGDVALCQAPTYHLAARLLAGRGLSLVPVADDGHGPSDAALDAALEQIPATQSITLYYTVPVHGNPTGRTVAPDRWERVLARTRDRGVLVVTDEVYAPLTYDGAVKDLALPLRVQRDSHVVRLGSFSKLLGAGLRVGWAVASSEVVDRIACDGLSQSGGGASHWAAMLVTGACADSWLDTHVNTLRDAYRERRDALCAALSSETGAFARWTVPKGGFFVWLTLNGDLRPHRVLAEAEARGVSFMSGDEFWPPGDATESSQPYPAIRLAFSAYAPDTLRRGVELLATALAAASDGSGAEQPTTSESLAEGT